MDNQQSSSSQKRNFFPIFLGIILLFFLLMSSVCYILLNKGQFTSHFSSNAPTRSTSFKEMLSGNILYKSGNTIRSFNPKTNKTVDIDNSLTNDPVSVRWSYSNNKVFINTESGVARIDLSNNKKDFIEIVNNRVYAEWIKNIGYSVGADGIFPSPDGSKVAVTMSSVQNYRRLFLFDFSNKTVLFLIDGADAPQWFSDSRYLFTGDDKASVVDTKTGVIKQIANVKTTPITISKEGYTFLWFTDSQGESRRPNMVVSSLQQTFPELNTQFDEENIVIPFSQFPVIARDFKKVTKVIPGYQGGEFFVEIDDGKSNIYLTNGGTFKRITPNNAYAYFLLDYSAVTRKVLAVKYRWIQKNSAEGTADASLVILDEGNYSETVAGIDNANFYEKALLKLGANLTPAYFSYGLFSPDGKFVLAPFLADGGGLSKWTIIATSENSAMPISADLGHHMYWLP